MIPECRNLSLQQAAEREACIADREYMEGTVTEVVPSDDGRSASVTWNDGSGNLGIGWPHEPFPLIGDTVRFYGEFGRRVKGADLNGFPVWFRTATEREREHREMVTAADQRKREKFEQDKDRLDAEYAALPEVFRDRIDKFRRTKADWRWECESYEMMCCVDAAKIFDAASGDLLDAPEEEYRAWFEQFTTAPYEDLGRMVPGLSEDHSGNSFSFAVRLAWFYLTDHAMVIAEHGALTPLIDCEEWGCPHPLPDDLVAKYDLDRDVLGGGN